MGSIVLCLISNPRSALIRQYLSSSIILKFFEQILTDVKDMCASLKNIEGENLKDLCKTVLSSARSLRK